MKNGIYLAIYKGDGSFCINIYDKCRVSMLNLHSQMAGLSKRRTIFYSEADFQFAFAWEIQRHILKQM